MESLGNVVIDSQHCAQRCSGSAKSLSDVVRETVDSLSQGLSHASPARDSLDEFNGMAERFSGINSKVAGQIEYQRTQIYIASPL